jgi:hypothetical protein
LLDVGHQAQAVGVVGVDGAVDEAQGVGGARQLHALAAHAGGLRGLQLEGHGDVAAAPARGGKVAQRLGKAVQRHQAAFVARAWPVSSAKRAWIHGERLCSTGLPITQYRSVGRVIARWFPGSGRG